MFNTSKRIFAAVAVTVALGVPTVASAMPVGYSGSLVVAPPAQQSAQPSQTVAPRSYQTERQLLDQQQTVKQLFKSEGGWHLTGAPTNRSAASSGGFDWGDAGIGAAGTIVLLVGGAGAAGAVRKRRAKLIVG
jgi:hypothetical protein